jgi:hypothetical protein
MSALPDYRRDNPIISELHATDPLLREVYERILVPNFPDPNDRDSFEAIQHYLAQQHPLISYHAVAMATNQVIGATLFGLFRGEVCFIKGEYTAISPEGRQCDAFDRLLEARKELMQAKVRHEGFEGIDFVLNQLVEEERLNPEQIRAYPVRPKANVRNWRIKGFRKIGFDYIQPSLSPGKDPVTHLGLYIQPWSQAYKEKSSLTPEEMKMIIDACVHFREGAQHAYDTAEYQDMVARIAEARIS